MASLPAHLLNARLALWRRRRAAWFDARLHGALDGEPGMPEPPEALRERHTVDRVDLDGTTAWEVGPPGGGARRQVLHLHGGGFVDEINAQGWALVAQLASVLDARVLVPLYPLAPAHTHRDAMTGVLAAYRRAGPGAAVVSADSAGAWLALSLHHAAREEGLARAAALVLLWPWMDPTLAGPEHAEIERRDPVALSPFLRRTGRAWAGKDDPDGSVMQPLRGDLSDLPPTVAVAGTRDLALADGRALARAGGSAVRLFEYDGAPHGFALVPYLPEARRAMRRIAETVERAA